MGIDELSLLVVRLSQAAQYGHGEYSLNLFERRLMASL